MSNKIAIVDYGSGNLSSVLQALRVAAPEAQVSVTRSASDIAQADRVVLPGQGAMPDCMHHLQQSGLREAVCSAARTKPLLGICIGQQMLFDVSEEGNVPGLGMFAGKVIKFSLTEQENGQNALSQEDESRCKIPHMGWNRVAQLLKHPLWQGIADHSWFYFVHSFYVKPQNLDMVAGSTTYGVTFTSAVTYSNIFATQFHPEKSAQDGLRLLRNFSKWMP